MAILSKSHANVLCLAALGALLANGCVSPNDNAADRPSVADDAATGGQGDADDSPASDGPLAGDVPTGQSDARKDGTISPGTDAPVDAPVTADGSVGDTQSAPFETGYACKANAACASNYCVDEICC